MNFEKRIIGDCSLYRGESLELLRAGVFDKIGAIVSDPPYGIGFSHGGGGRGGTLGDSLRIDNLGLIHCDDAPFDPQPWLAAAPRNKFNKAVSGGDALIVLFGADRYMQRLPTGGTLLAWDKHVGRGSDDSFADCEWAWCGRKVKREVFRWLWKGVICQKNPMDNTPSKGGNGHGGAAFARVHVSQKPVELMRWCIDKVRPLAGLPILV